MPFYSLFPNTLLVSDVSPEFLPIDNTGREFATRGLVELLSCSDFSILPTDFLLATETPRFSYSASHTRLLHENIYRISQNLQVINLTSHVFLIS